jgi:hypothetical protein
MPNLSSETLLYLYTEAADSYELPADNAEARSFALSHGLPLAATGPLGWAVICAACQGVCDVTYDVDSPAYHG